MRGRAASASPLQAPEKNYYYLYIGISTKSLPISELVHLFSRQIFTSEFNTLLRMSLPIIFLKIWRAKFSPTTPTNNFFSTRDDDKVHQTPNTTKLDATTTMKVSCQHHIISRYLHVFLGLNETSSFYPSTILTILLYCDPFDCPSSKIETTGHTHSIAFGLGCIHY